MTATRLSGEPTRAGAFSVPSTSMPGEHWSVEWITEGTCWCGCPAFARKNSCRHVEAVAWAIEVEVRELMAQSTPEQRARAAARLDEIAQEFAL
jgi:hypothetical protein